MSGSSTRSSSSTPTRASEQAARPCGSPAAPSSGAAWATSCTA